MDFETSLDAATVRQLITSITAFDRELIQNILSLLVENQSVVPGLILLTKAAGAQVIDILATSDSAADFLLSETLPVDDRLLKFLLQQLCSNPRVAHQVLTMAREMNVAMQPRGETAERILSHDETLMLLQRIETLDPEIAVCLMALMSPRPSVRAGIQFLATTIAGPHTGIATSAEVAAGYMLNIKTDAGRNAERVRAALSTTCKNYSAVAADVAYALDLVLTGIAGMTGLPLPEPLVGAQASGLARTATQSSIQVPVSGEPSRLANLHPCAGRPDQGKVRPGPAGKRTHAEARHHALVQGEGGGKRGGKRIRSRQESNAGYGTKYYAEEDENASDYSDDDMAGRGGGAASKAKSSKGHHARVAGEDRGKGQSQGDRDRESRVAGAGAGGSATGGYQPAGKVAWQIERPIPHQLKNLRKTSEAMRDKVLRGRAGTVYMGPTDGIMDKREAQKLCAARMCASLCEFISQELDDEPTAEDFTWILNAQRWLALLRLHPTIFEGNASVWLSPSTLDTAVDMLKITGEEREGDEDYEVPAYTAALAASEERARARLASRRANEGGSSRHVSPLQQTVDPEGDDIIGMGERREDRPTDGSPSSREKESPRPLSRDSRLSQLETQRNDEEGGFGGRELPALLPAPSADTSTAHFPVRAPAVAAVPIAPTTATGSASVVAAVSRADPLAALDAMVRLAEEEEEEQGQGGQA